MSVVFHDGSGNVVAYYSDNTASPWAGMTRIDDPDGVVPTLELKYYKMVGNVITEMNQAEKDAVDNANLPVYKAKYKRVMNESVRAFILVRYKRQAQRSLGKFYIRVVDSGTKPNRAAHIAAYIDWLDAVLTDYHAKKTSVTGAADKAAVDAVTYDWDALFGDAGTDTVDPKVTIKNTLAITN